MYATTGHADGGSSHRAQLRLGKVSRMSNGITSVMDKVRGAGQTTVGRLLREQARIRPSSVAVEGAGVKWTYLAFNDRVNRLANFLVSRGVSRGDRIAILSENRSEYMELEFAAAKLGAVVAALNWRLAEDEQIHCIALTKPRIGFVSLRFRDTLQDINHCMEKVIVFGSEYESILSHARNHEPDEEVDVEDPLVILYTSGTTGRPKGAAISHRAFLARVSVFCMDYGMTRADTFVAWPPMFHMASTDLSIGMLLIGGKVIQVDGFDVDRLVDIVTSERLGWLVLMPGVIERFVEVLTTCSITPKRILMVGAMADLLPRHQITEITRLLRSPYLNSFGSTETGIPPCSGSLLLPGETHMSLSKTQSSFCEVRLVNSQRRLVADGSPGELEIRGPTLFSGYWCADDVNEKEFRQGWFNMGDVFRRNSDGSYDFVDRSKYLIKSGGENIYPAEIERILLEDDRVADAVVVRRSDPQWGEVPVAVVARKDVSLTEMELMQRCRKYLAGYKQPKQIYFVPLEEMPRSTTGKIQRHEIEKWIIQKGNHL